MPKNKTTGKNIETDVKGLKAMASRLRAAVTTITGYTGKKYAEIKPSVRDSSALANDILAVVKILRELAKADEFACARDGRLFHNTEFSAQARHAVFNSRLLANNRKPLKMEEKS